MVQKNTKKKKPVTVRLVNLTSLEDGVLLAWAQGIMPRHTVSAGRAVSQSHNIAIYDDVQTVVAQATKSGPGLTATLSDWKKTVEKALKSAETNPEGTFLLATGAAAHAPKETSQALGNWLGTDVAQVAFPSRPDTSTVDDMVLVSILRQEPGLRKTSTRLAAKGFALTLPKETAKPDLDDACKELGQLRRKAASQQATLDKQVQWIESLRRTVWEEAARASQAEARALSAESRLYQTNSQLQHVVVEKDKYASATVSTERALVQLQQESSKILNIYQSEDEKKQVRLQAERVQSRLLTRQIEQERKEAADREHELKLNLLYLQTKVEEISSSTSWKITRPLRAIRKPFGRKPKE